MPGSGLVIGLLLLAAARPTVALDPSLTIAQYDQRHWSTEDGLPQVTVNDVVQDRLGYLWIATFGGLARFDGQRFEVLDSVGRCSDRILSLEVDPEGTIWVGSERSGLCRIEGGALRPLGPLDGREPGGVAQIVAAEGGGIWAATSQGLVRIVGEHARWYTTEDGLPHRNVLAVDEHDDGTVWVGTRAGLCILDGERCTTPLWAGDLGQARVTAIHHSSFGASWIGSELGLHWWKEGEVDRYLEVAPHTSISVIEEDRSGGLWIGLERGGVLRILPRREALSGFDPATGDAVRALFPDREGSLWIGTSGNGLVRLSQGAAIPIAVGDRSGSVPVLPIVADGGGRAWAGTLCRGLARIEPGGTELVGVAQGLANECVTALHEDREGHLWIGTSGDGLFRMDEEGRVHRTGGPTTDEGLVRAIAEEAPGRLLVGTDEGLFRFDVGSGRFDPVDGTRHLDVFFVDATDPDEGIWLGTRQGAVRLEAGGTSVWDREKGLTHETVRAVHRDADGVIWIGTYGGGLFRLEKDELFAFGGSRGLPDRAVSSIVEDEQGRLWMTGNLGVTRVDRADLDRVARGETEGVEASVFDRRDGMPSSETNGGGQPSAFLDPDGRLWVATVSGIALFDTRRESFNLVPPPVHIERVLVDGVAIDPDRKAILAADAKNLEIHYTALAFNAPEKVRFRVRLRGFDDDWVEMGGRRVVYYPVIPPGDLRFRVVAANEDGVWNQEGAVFAFEMTKPFLQTKGFVALAVAMAGLLFFALYRIRLLAAARREQRLELEVERRTAELARLTELTEVINEAVTIPEVLERLYDDLRPIVPYDRIGLGLLDEDRLVLRAVWARSEQEPVALREGFESSIASSSLLRLLETGRPRIIGDLEQYLEEHPESESTRLILAEGIRSSLTCPLRAMGQAVGCVFFSSSTPHTYDESHAAFLEQIAGHLSSIVVKSKLYEELQAANRELGRLASLDPLTGLPNRRSFDEHLDREWRRAIRSASPIGLLMIDVDAFKQFNDHYGHAEGDAALQAVASVLQTRIQRAGDLAARIGGEEFAVVLQGTGVEDGGRIAEEIRRAVEAGGRPHRFSPCADVVTVSVGVASTVPTTAAKPGGLIREADRALYEAKNRGRNRVVRADPSGSGDGASSG